jgi:hypothetical protein
MFELIDAEMNNVVAVVNTIEDVKINMKHLCMNGFNKFAGNSNELCGQVIFVKDLNTNKIIQRYVFKRSHKNVNFVPLKNELRRLKNGYWGPAQINAIFHLEQFI